MDIILVEAWDAFNMSSKNIIRESFKNILPFIPTNFYKNTHTYIASIQFYSRAKAEDINVM